MRRKERKLEAQPAMWIEVLLHGLRSDKKRTDPAPRTLSHRTTILAQCRVDVGVDLIAYMAGAPSDVAPPVYIYEALKPDFIRILHLDAGVGSSPLKGHLVECHLNELRELWAHNDESVANARSTEELDAAYNAEGDGILATRAQIKACGYETLSYVWGDPSYTDFVLLRDDSGVENQLPIHRSLSDALRHLRLKDATRKIWTDAVCINQEDVTERSQQVGIMGDIYRLASNTSVWLGLSTPNDSLAFRTAEVASDLLHDMNQYFLTEECYAAGIVKTAWKYVLLGDQNLVNSTSCSCCGKMFSAPCRSLLDGILAVGQTLQRSYMTRLWVVQELALSRSTDVYSGHHHATWQQINDVHSVFMQLYVNHEDRTMISEQQIASLTTQFRAFRSLGNYRRAFTSAQWTRQGLIDPPMLFNRVLQLSTKNCLDPRDRFYGVRSICMDGAARSMRPDYEISTAELYTSFASDFVCATEVKHEYVSGHVNNDQVRRFSRRTPPSALLALCGTEIAREEYLARPSWVPDFHALTDRSRRKLQSYQSTSYDPARFNFGSGYVPLSYRPWEDQPSKISVKARACATIVAVACCSLQPTVFVERQVDASSPKFLPAVLEWYKTCSAFVKAYSQDACLSLTLAELLQCGGDDSMEACMTLSEFNKACAVSGLVDISIDAEEAWTDLRSLLRRDSPQYDFGRQLAVIDCSGSKTMGWVPPSARIDDQIFVIAGAPWPFALRLEQKEHHTLLGDCWLPELAEWRALGLSETTWMSLEDRRPNVPNELCMSYAKLIRKSKKMEVVSANEARISGVAFDAAWATRGTTSRQVSRAALDGLKGEEGYQGDDERIKVQESVDLWGALEVLNTGKMKVTDEGWDEEAHVRLVEAWNAARDRRAQVLSEAYENMDLIQIG